MVVWKICLFLYLVIVGESIAAESLEIDADDYVGFRELPRFWTSTGFCPPAPINASTAFLLSTKVKQNLELIGSIPNSGITHVRTHWILQLIDAQNFNTSVEFSFRNFQNFLDFLKRNQLYPHIEFMGDPGGIFSKRLDEHNISDLWKNLTHEMITSSIDRFGEEYVQKFRFETWNEPDLLNYNILQYNVSEFLRYVTAIREGLPEKFKLRGPAGLYHSRNLHKLCFGILVHCGSNPCPIDIFTFHRKGEGRAEEIFENELNLLTNLTQEFPWIQGIEISNSEADPTTGWSLPNPMNSDVRYAVELVKTVLIHWNARDDLGIFKNLESISHDNGFLSYHPYEFDQRTLLAHFRMNQSRPIYSEFLKKPVFSALSLLANLGKLSGHTKHTGNITHLTTVTLDKNSGFYSCILIVSAEQCDSKTIRISVKLPEGKNLVVFGEILDQKLTNPARIWKKFSSPPFPRQDILRKMRRVQTPAIVIPPESISSSGFRKIVKTFPPFVLSLRFCENKTDSRPIRVKNVHLHWISEERVTIRWNEAFQVARCVKNYQVFFKPLTRKYKRRQSWMEITKGWHIMDLSFDFWRPHGVSGLYTVRSVDILGRFGAFSKRVFLKI
ncbi:alpha-L-iduronidase [Sergentomyia squamirostris]